MAGPKWFPNHDGGAEAKTYNCAQKIETHVTNIDAK